MSEFTAEDFVQETLANMERLKNENEGLRHVRDDLRTIVDELHAEIRDLQARPVTLDSLAAAYAAAEEPTDDNPIRGGDVIIYQHDGGRWAVREVEPHEHDDDDWSCKVRVLSRAPKRAPWQDLADVISEYTYHSEPDALARALYRGGVRVVGGDDDE